MKQLLIWVLWPSFLIAAGVNGVFFSVFDPADLLASSEPGTVSAVAAYTLGFFAFWTIGACSSAFTCFLQRDADQVNRLWCSLPNAKRPPGCRIPE